MGNEGTVVLGGIVGGVNTDDAVIGSFFPELGCLQAQALGLIVAGN